MRRFAPLVSALLLALVASLLVALSLPGTARAKEKKEKVDKRLAAQAQNAAPDSDLSVIVVGSDPAAALGRHGGKKKSDLDLVGGVSASVKAKDLEEVAADDAVAFIAADVPVAPMGGGLDPAKLQTLYPLLDGAPRAWQNDLDGDGIGIALIDSGVKKTDLERLSIVKLPDLELGEDRHGHGTLVAGVLAGRSGDGRYVGIAPKAKIYAININRPEGVRSSDVIAGLAWVFENAHKNHIRVVNLSLQETVPSSYQQSLLDLAVERLWAAGILVVTAAGNGGPGAIDFAPANDPLALTVGATDTNETLTTADDSVASFSASGTTVDGFQKPELLAPGRRIITTLQKDSLLAGQAPAQNRINDKYASISGTSFSAPQAAGAAALLFQQHPDWSPDQVKWLLTQVAQPVAGASAGALAVGAASDFTGTPGLANQGVPALVCPPTATCTPGGSVGTVSGTWNSATWNSATWNSATWNSATWNSGTWNSGTWNSGTWNSGTWNSGTWNSMSWTFSPWE